ncbi:MAG TPA: hypothetical protein VGF17_03540 [Phytomonospora sp.]
MQLRKVLVAAAIALGAAAVVGGTAAAAQWEGDAVSYYQGKAPHVVAEDYDRDYAYQGKAPHVIAEARG